MKKQTKVAASMTIHNPAKMSKAGARRIANWMRERAADLEAPEVRLAMSSRFRARYYYGKVLES